MPFVSKLATGSGNTQVVAGVPGQRIYGIGYEVIGKNSDTDVQLRSGTTTVLTQGFTPETGTGGWIAPSVGTDSEYLFITDVGEDLNLNLSGTGRVALNLRYVQR